MKRSIILDGRATIFTGDCLAVLAKLPADSVDCVVCSPPYWGLRSYDENSIRISPLLSAKKRAWLLVELKRRNVHARR